MSTKLNRRLLLKALEDRTVPTTFIVNSNLDDGSPGTLRAAITSANADAAVPHTININPGAATITLSSELPTITKAMTINGTSAALTVIDAAGLSRIVTIDPTTAKAAVVFQNMKLTGGNTTLSGGGIVNQDAALTLRNVWLTGNTSTAIHANLGGGGILLAVTAGSLLVEDSVISDNFSSDDGAGISVGGNSTVTIRRSLISGNSAITPGAGPGTFNGSSGGGIYFFDGGTLLVEDSTISGNNAASLSQAGGGVYLYNTSAKIVNSTISGNLSGGKGGGIVAVNTASLSLIGSTVANNNAGVDGGGISVASGAGVLTLTSTIVAQNTQVSGGDISAPGKVTANSSNIGNTTGIGSIAGTLSLLNVSPNLLPLGNNGGFNLPDGSTIQTHVPGPGSTVRNKGTNPESKLNDQRGAGFIRVLGSSVDIGSVESDDPTPTASSTVTDVTVVPADPVPQFYNFSITYSDPNSPINSATYKQGDEVLVTGPGGYSEFGIFVSENVTGNTAIVSYKVGAPDNTVVDMFDTSDNGDYTVTVKGGQVFDTDGTPVAVQESAVGTFKVALPTFFTVLNANDSGAGSLRDAIDLTNGNSAESIDVINFDPGFFSTPQTIKLLFDMSTIIAPVSIIGPGALKLTIDGDNLFRPMTIDLTTAGGKVSLSGATLTKGFSLVEGGGVLNADSKLTLTSVVITGNSATTNGGGIALGTEAQSLTLVDSVVSKNTALGDAATGNADGAGGGALFVEAQSDVVISRSVISGNNAAGAINGSGGALFFDEGGTLMLTDSTLSGNTASGTDATGIGVGGGAIYFDSFVGATIVNSTISGNTSASAGGAIELYGFFGSLAIVNSTVAFNTAANNGGGINFTAGAGTGLLSLTSSIVAKNVGTTGPDVNGPATVSKALVTSVSGATFTGTPIIGDPLLAPLGNNGGFKVADGSTIQTHAITGASPALNAGSNSLSLVFDQRGTGFNRSSGAAVDIGAFEFQVLAPAAKLVSTKFGDGTPQRSNVTSITLTFDQAVTFTGPPEAAFTVQRQGSAGTVNVTAAVSGNSVTLTFSGTFAETGTKSLIDGKYNITINAAQFASTGFDGNGDGTAGDSFTSLGDLTNKQFRLFGDSDGDGDVDNTDFVAFRVAFGNGPSIFNADGDGDTDNADFVAFRARFGTTVP